MIDAIDELYEWSDSDRRLKTFHSFHRANPNVLDSFVRAITDGLKNELRAFSFWRLWQDFRWKPAFRNSDSGGYRMNDHLVSFYARAIIILHPEINGQAELRRSKNLSVADEAFGTRLGPKRLGDYSGRLVWADGTTIENGWRPKRADVARPGVRRDHCATGNQMPLIFELTGE